MRKALYRLFRRVFRREFCQDVGAPLGRAHELGLIDSRLLHELDAALKYHQGRLAALHPHEPSGHNAMLWRAGGPTKLRGAVIVALLGLAIAMFAGACFVDGPGASAISPANPDGIPTPPCPPPGPCSGNVQR